MIGRPPRSTLFPYTPLSRSRSKPARLKGNVFRARMKCAPGEAQCICNFSATSFVNNMEHRHEQLRRVPGDRKSTRLNSSHSQISYAVFCLKKKKAVELEHVHHRTIHPPVPSPHSNPFHTYCLAPLCEHLYGLNGASTTAAHFRYCALSLSG